MLKNLIKISISIIFISCSGNVKTETPKEIEKGQLDSIVINTDTKAPTKAIKAFENRAYYLDSFPSKDSLIMFADIYIKNNNAPFILLCHQAGYSRGEYKEIAKRLNLYGYSIIAIDQRSGGEVNNVKNKTYLNALLRGENTDYMSSKQDIEAAIDYIYSYYKKPILLVGSSYSASLAMLIGKNNPKIKAVAAFSPIEYLDSISLKDSIKGFDKPLFITSSKKEINSINNLISDIEFHLLNQYKPKTIGVHGSKALWSKNNESNLYWEAFYLFLKYEYPI